MTREEVFSLVEGIAKTNGWRWADTVYAERHRKWIIGPYVWSVYVSGRLVDRCGYPAGKGLGMVISDRSGEVTPRGVIPRMTAEEAIAVAQRLLAPHLVAPSYRNGALCSFEAMLEPTWFGGGEWIVSRNGTESVSVNDCSGEGRLLGFWYRPSSTKV
jgi:hypothetical protein